MTDAGLDGPKVMQLTISIILPAQEIMGLKRQMDVWLILPLFLWSVIGAVSGWVGVGEGTKDDVAR